MVILDVLSTRVMKRTPGVVFFSGLRIGALYEGRLD
jgi:hypothetical protein